MSDETETKLAELEAAIEKLRAHIATTSASEQPDPGRRSLLGPLALLGVGGALLAAPKEARADLGFGEMVEAVTRGATSAINNTIASPIQGTFNATITAYSILASLGLSPEIMALLRCLGLSGSAGINFDICSLLQEAVRGEGSMMTTGRIDETMEKLWHREPERTSATMDEATIEAFDTYYQQVRASQAVTAANADALPTLAAEDDMQLALLNAAAAGGHLIEVNARLGHLIFNTNRHLAMVVQGQNAQQQTLGSQLMVGQHQRYLEALDRQRERERTMIPVAGANPTVSGRGGL